MKNPSLYFENVEQYIALHPDHAPLAMLMAAVRSNGCPDDVMDAVINSAIAHEINLVVTPREKTLTNSKDRLDYDTFNEYNPTNEELVNDIVARFDNLGFDRAKGIVDFLINKQALTVYPDGKLYRTKVLLPRLPLIL